MYSQNPLLDLLCRDLWLLGEIALSAMLVFLMPIPPLVFSLAYQQKQFSWRALPLAILIAWLCGVVGSIVGGLAIAGVSRIAMDMITTEHVPLDEGAGNAILFTGFLIGIWFSYRQTNRYYARLAEWQASPDVKRTGKTGGQRRFAFSLQTFFLAQVGLMALCGLWLALRRPTLTSAYRHQALQARQLEIVSDAKTRFSKFGWQVYIVGQPPRLCLFSSDAPLRNFNDQALDLIRPDDRLDEIDIRSDDLTDAGLENLAQNRTVKIVKISSTQITDEGINHLCELPRLYWLEIRSGNLTSESVQSLQGMKELRRLVIALPPDAKEAIAEFQAARPEVNLELVGD